MSSSENFSDKDLDQSPISANDSLTEGVRGSCPIDTHGGNVPKFGKVVFTYLRGDTLFFQRTCPPTER
jgi:hypothetical protein